MGVRSSELEVTVERLYRGVLHANAVCLFDDDARGDFVATTVDASNRWSVSDVEWLLRCGAWRSQIVGAWIAAVSPCERVTELIGRLLFESTTSFAGQGYCLALASVASDEAAECLTRYLDRWLPRVGDQFDQAWAMGALLVVDGRNGSSLAGPYREPWRAWAGRTGRRDARPVDDAIRSMLALTANSAD